MKNNQKKGSKSRRFKKYTIFHHKMESIDFHNEFEKSSTSSFEEEERLRRLSQKK